MANAKDAYRAVAAVLEGNPGNHNLEAIIEGTEVLEDTKITETQATRALGRLVKEGRAALTEDGDERRWRAGARTEEEAGAEPVGEDPRETSESAPEAAEPDTAEDDGAAAEEGPETETETSDPTPETIAEEQDGEHEAAEAAESDDPDDSDDTEAEGEGDQEQIAGEPTLPIEPLPDPDPQILHIARTIVDLDAAFTIEALCNRAYLPTKRRLVLNVLRAMAAHGLVECSHPFDPDSNEAIWEVVYDGVLMDAAVRVQMADAPDRMTCPTCGQTKTFGGAPRPRTAGTGVRNDGKTYLAAGELTGFVIDWVTAPENTGEEFTVRMITKELVAAHPGKVSDNSDGAIKNALDKMLRPDHKRLRYNDRALVALVRERGPRTYRALGV